MLVPVFCHVLPQKHGLFMSLCIFLGVSHGLMDRDDSQVFSFDWDGKALLALAVRRQAAFQEVRGTGGTVKELRRTCIFSNVFL